MEFLLRNRTAIWYIRPRATTRKGFSGKIHWQNRYASRCRHLPYDPGTEKVEVIRYGTRLAQGRGVAKVDTYALHPYCGTNFGQCSIDIGLETSKERHRTADYTDNTDENVKAVVPLLLSAASA